MRYQKPFTPAQRQRAVAACRAFAAQLAAVKSKFRPRSDDQREVARELHRTVEDLIAALRVPNDKVNVPRLNELRERADVLSIRYAVLWLR